VKKHTLPIVLWAIAALTAGRLAWISLQHHMPTLDTATITLFALYGTHAGAQRIANAIRATRQTGATR